MIDINSLGLLEVMSSSLRLAADGEDSGVRREGTVTSPARAGSVELSPMNCTRHWSITSLLPKPVAAAGRSALLLTHLLEELPVLHANTFLDNGAVPGTPKP